jgi:hypothetical protein
VANSKPGIHHLLIAFALDADLRRRLLASPDEVFQDFDLTPQEQDLLRHPDHRLLPLLGAALAQQNESPAAPPLPSPAAPQPHAVFQAHTLPDLSLALTLVPCAQYVEGRLSALSYAVWVNPLPAGTDPASLPPPQGAVFPGQPLAPLHAVIQVSVLQMQDAAGNPQVGLSACFRQSSNMTAPLQAESALASAEVRAAVAAVRSADSQDRYARIIDLLRTLQGGEVG